MRESRISARKLPALYSRLASSSVVTLAPGARRRTRPSRVARRMDFSSVLDGSRKSDVRAEIACSVCDSLNPSTISRSGGGGGTGVGVGVGSGAGVGVALIGSGVATGTGWAGRTSCAKALAVANRDQRTRSAFKETQCRYGGALYQSESGRRLREAAPRAAARSAAVAVTPSTRPPEVTGLVARSRGASVGRRSRRQARQHRPARGCASLSRVTRIAAGAASTTARASPPPWICSRSVRSVQPSRRSRRSLSSRRTRTWVSGSPKRQLNSSTCGPLGVSINPA